MTLLLIPVGMIVLFFVGLLVAMRMPGVLESHFMAQDIGEAMAALNVSFYSNLIVILYLVIASILLLVLSITWLRAAMYRLKKRGWQVNVAIAALSILVVATSCGFSYGIITGEDLLNKMTDARTDALMLEGGAYVVYYGEVATLGTETYPGMSYSGKPKSFYELNIKTGTNWVRVYCPKGMAEESEAAYFGPDEPYHQLMLYYMPNTGTVVKIGQPGEFEDGAAMQASQEQQE